MGRWAARVAKEKTNTGFFARIRTTTLVGRLRSYTRPFAKARWMGHPIICSTGRRLTNVVYSPEGFALGGDGVSRFL